MTAIHSQIDMKLCFLRQRPTNFSTKDFKYSLAQLKSVINKSNNKYKDNYFQYYHRTQLKDLTNQVNDGLLKQKKQQLLHGNSNLKYSIDEAVDANISSTRISSFKEILSQNYMLTMNFNKKIEDYLRNGYEIGQQLNEDRSEQYHRVLKEFILENTNNYLNAYDLAIQFFKISPRNSLWKIFTSQLQGLGDSITLQNIGKNTLSLLEKRFKQQIPSDVHEINRMFMNTILRQNSDLSVVQDNYGIYKYAVIYYILKTGELQRLEQLNIDRDLKFLIIQFFKYGHISDKGMLKMDDDYLLEIYAIIKGDDQNLRLGSNIDDFGWRCLTIFTKQLKYSNPTILHQYQRMSIKQLKTEQNCEQDKYQRFEHILYSLSYQAFLQLPNNELNLQLRLHFGIVLYSAQLIEKKLLQKLIKQFLEYNDNLSISIDYTLLLQDQQLIFLMLNWYLLKKDKIPEFFGIKRDSFMFEIYSQYERLKKYFDQRTYDNFINKLINSNVKNDMLITAVLQNRIIKNNNSCIQTLLLASGQNQQKILKAIEVVSKNKLQPFEIQILSFYKQYLKSYSMISRGQFKLLKSQSRNYFTNSSERNSRVLQYLLQQSFNIIYLNYLKMKIIYCDKTGEHLDQNNVSEEFVNYINHRKDQKQKRSQEEQIVRDIKEYLA